MVLRLPRLAAFAWLAFGWQASAFATLTVEQWDLVTGIIDSTGSMGTGPTVVQNPYLATDDVAYASSHAHTEYDLSWTDSAGNFNFQVSHAAAGVDPSLLETVSAGYMNITLDSDSLLALNYAIEYDLPRTLTTLDVTFQVGYYEQEKFIEVFGRPCHADTLLQAPAVGICSANGDVLLPGGRTYLVHYEVRNNTFGPIGDIATDSGDLQFTLQEVPEPTGLGVTLLMMMVRRRKRRIS